MQSSVSAVSSQPLITTLVDDQIITPSSSAQTTREIDLSRRHQQFNFPALPITAFNTPPTKRRRQIVGNPYQPPRPRPQSSQLPIFTNGAVVPTINPAMTRFLGVRTINQNVFRSITNVSRSTGQITRVNRKSTIYQNSMRRGGWSKIRGGQSRIRVADLEFKSVSTSTTQKEQKTYGNVQSWCGDVRASSK